MKTLPWLFLGFLFAASSVADDSKFTDPRDQQTYGVAQVGELRWMTENLRFAAPRSACYDNLPANCNQDGRLYPWEEALQACPVGWHLATEFEWRALELALGVPFEELNSNRERGEPTGQQIKTTGSHRLRFPFAGYGTPEGTFEAKGETAAVWTATESDYHHAWHRDLDVSRTGIWRSRVYKPWLLSVRCVENRGAVDRD